MSKVYIVEVPSGDDPHYDCFWGAFSTYELAEAAAKARDDREPDGDYKGYYITERDVDAHA
jgi:hypothetical protein